VVLQAYACNRDATVHGLTPVPRERSDPLSRILPLPYKEAAREGKSYVEIRMIRRSRDEAPGLITITKPLASFWAKSL
jgi:hypothetical protein